jgi:hypothetical protein
MGMFLASDMTLYFSVKPKKMGANVEVFMERSMTLR